MHYHITSILGSESKCSRTFVYRPALRGSIAIGFLLLMGLACAPQDQVRELDGSDAASKLSQLLGFELEKIRDAVGYEYEGKDGTFDAWYQFSIVSSEISDLMKARQLEATWCGPEFGRKGFVDAPPWFQPKPQAPVILMGESFLWYEGRSETALFHRSSTTRCGDEAE